jgi:MerR family mercuric resistance operon transcriptional regulator
MKSMRIGQVARLANVTVQTIRFYEKKGLLPRSSRRLLSGYREFAPQTVELLRGIKQARAVGFSIREIKEVLALTGWT